MKNIILVLALVAIVSSKGFLENQIEKYFDTQNQYDHSKSSTLFHYTKIVKCSLDDIKTWNCGHYCDLHPGMTEVQSFYNAAHSAQAYCGYNTKENLIVVVYRSTDDIVNWINNIKFNKHDFGDCTNCKVHLGFWETYTDLSSQIISCAKSLKTKHPNGKFMLAGHSLGGAIAALTAVDITRLGYKVDHFYTYGAPRVGNNEFYAWFKSYVNPTEHWRVTHYQDIVVHTPTISMGFHHLEQEVWYNRENTTFKVCNDSAKEDDTCANSQWADSVADHTSYFNDDFPCRTSFVPPQATE